MRKFTDGQVVETIDGAKYVVLWTCTNKDSDPTHLFVAPLHHGRGKRIKKKIPISQVKQCS